MVKIRLCCFDRPYTIDVSLSHLVLRSKTFKKSRFKDSFMERTIKALNNQCLNIVITRKMSVYTKYKIKSM